jgi:hypothetical protein
LATGPVRAELDDGTVVTGFLADASTADHTADIVVFGG